MRLITAFPLLVLGSFMLSTNLMAADTAVKTPSPAQAAQQKRMADCNHQASTKSLKGENRSTFMSTCLKAKSSSTVGKSLTPQQQKMKDCNADAKAKSLKGNERKTFMSACLKKSA
ncbi:MAG: phosphate-starvation-inducible protein PsiF [Serratia symbiotica]|nr:phosphate-starvation-inducible protein PsiF [Serratia symbiotica]